MSVTRGSKIYFVASTFLPDRGGGAKTRHQQICQLIKAGYNIKLVIKKNSPVFAENLAKHIIPESINFFDRLLTKLRIFPDVHVRWSYSVFKYIASDCIDGDVVFITTGGPLSLCMISILLKLNGVKARVVINLHDLPDFSTYEKSSPIFPKGFCYQYFEYYAYKSSDLILCNSRKMVDLIGSKYPKLKTRLDYFYFGFEDNKHLSQLRNSVVASDLKNNKKIVIGAIGTMGELQGPDFLVRSLIEHNIKNKFPYELVFIGDKPKISNNDNRSVKLQPYINQIDLNKYANDYLDIGFLSIVNRPVFKSAIPTKFFEYVNLGLPILATIPIDSEAGVVIRENKIGWVISHGDIDAIVNLLNFLKDNKHEINVAKNNIKKIRSYFSDEFTQIRMINSLKQLIQDY